MIDNEQYIQLAISAAPKSSDVGASVQYAATANDTTCFVIILGEESGLTRIQNCEMTPPNTRNLSFKRLLMVY